MKKIREKIKTLHRITAHVKNTHRKNSLRIYPQKKNSTKTTKITAE